VTRWLQTEPPVENTQLYKNREGGPHGKSLERRVVGSVKMGEQVAVSGQEPVEDRCLGGGDQGHPASIDSVTSGAKLPSVHRPV
jgi:hypothetical protein